jgi:hypothetical protein
MTKKTTFAGRRGQTLIALSIGIMVLGVAAVLVSVGLEWQGFGGGFAVGAGIGATLIGTYFWGWTTGLRRSASRERWLPSEDAGR